MTTANAAVLVHDFYLPMPEAQVYQANSTIETGTSTTQDSTFSIVSAGAGTLVYYDHWEDGYEINLANPAQATTRIWGDGNNANGIPPGFANDPLGLSAGAVITLRNNVPLPRNPSLILFDGRDRVSGTKALVISRAGWPVTPGSVFAGAVGVLATVDYGTQFISPVGQDLTNRLFQYVGLFVMAGQDATSVTIDSDGTGTNVAVVVTLNRGESYLVNGGIKKGASVTSSKPVQADIIIGRIGGRYASDWFTLIPVDQWGSTYYTPVATANNGNPAFVYLYNPNPTPITINYTTRVGSGSFSIPATNGVFQYQMPKASGAKFTSAGGQPFFAICTVGANPASESANNWGFTLLPAEGLTTEAVIGWGPGSSDLSVNGSPAWVTPVAATRIYVDYNGDRVGALTNPIGDKYDAHYDLVALESKTVYDPDKDQTAMRIYTLDGVLITAAWGQDPDVAAPGNPYIDAGTTVLPFPVPVVNKTSVIITDNAPLGLNIGDVLEYTVELENKGLLPLGNTVVIDAPPPSLGYVTNSTTLDGVSIPDSGSGSSFPLDGSGYTVPIILRAGISTFKFRATVLSSGSITNTVNVGGTTISAQNIIMPAPPAGATACSLNFTDSAGVNVGSYAAGTNIFVTLADGDKNTSSNSIQTLSLAVSNVTRGDIEVITLTETSTNSGVFRNLGGLASSTTSGLPQQDGVLNVAPGDSISVRYVDPVFGDICNASAVIQTPARNKILYLSDPAQALDRVDPVATSDNTTAQTAVLGLSSVTNTVTVVNVSTNSSAGNNVTITNHVSAAGTNTLLLVGLSMNPSGGGSQVTNITFAGQSLTKVTELRDGAFSARVEIWQLVNPPVATSNIVIRATNGCGNLFAGAMTLTGVNQVTPFSNTNLSTANTGNGTNIITSAANELVFNVLAQRSSTTAATASSGVTSRWTGLNGDVAGAGGTKAGAASVTNSWTRGTGGAVWVIAALSIRPAVVGGSGTNVAAFTQTPAFCQNFAMPSGGAVVITNFVSAITGSMPTNPAITARLMSGSTNILTLTNAVYNSGNSNLIWSGILTNNVTISSGQLLTYVISNGLLGVSFRVDYDSTTKPSKIALPTTTVIDVETLGVYDAPYPGGNLVGTPTAGSTLYVRSMVSDPFGSYDITSLNLNINGPGASGDLNLVLTNSSVVTNTGCAKIYEYVWQTSANVGSYDISATANEGTEGITDTAAANVTLTFLDLGTPSSIQFTSGNNGPATNAFSANATVCIRITDLDQNANPALIETLSATISSATDSEILLLTETGTNTGVFTACLNTSTNTGIGTTNLLNAPVGSVLSASYTDPNDPGDQSSATATIVPLPGTPGVKMNKTLVAPSDGQAGIGETVQFDLQVVNTGSTVLTNISLTDNFPSARLSFQSASRPPNVTNATTLTWTNVGPLNPGQSTNISVFFTAISVGNVTNSATANGVTATNTSTVTLLITQSALTVTKTLLNPTNGPVNVGSNVTFRIVMQNTGSTVISSLPLEDNFSASYYQFVSATISPNGSGAGSLLWTNLANPTLLATNATITIDVTLLVIGEGNPANNTAAANFAVDSFGNPVPAASSTVGLVTAAAKIRGFVYNDIDRSGTLTTNDVGLESVTIELFSDPNSDGNPADGTLLRLTATDTTGAYELLNLSTGAYVVVETDLPGFASSAPLNNRLALNIVSLTTSSNNNFFDFLPSPTNYATISGVVWNDVNFNGTNNVGEVGISNVTVELVQDVNTNQLADVGEPTVANSITGTNGSYSFANVLAGNYVIRETDLFGYYSTGDVQPPNNNQIGISVAAGSTNINKDFYDHFNSSPVANDDTASTPKNVAVTINPLANDSDPENNPLSITIATPSSGSATIIGGTNILFTPATNFIGSATISYTISDGNGGSASALITVSVTNNAPVANNDSFVTGFNTVLVVPAAGVLTNDTDLNGDSLTAALVVGTTNGVLSLSSNGGFTYTPATNYIGTDSFTYRANDGTATSAVATVTLTVSAPIADIAVFKTGPSNVFAGMSFNYTLLLTNSGPGLAPNLAITDNLPTNVTFVSASAGGSFSNGLVSWSGFSLVSGGFTNLTLTVTAPAAGAFTNRASATSGGNDPNPTNNNGSATNSQVITTVTNSPPIANNDGVTTPEDTGVSISVLTNDTDLDGDTLSLVSALATNGTVNIVGTNLVFTPATNFNGIALINYTITDGNGGTNSAVVTVTVTPVNDGPVANNQSVITPEDVSTNLVLSGTDIDGGALSFAILNGPTNGVLSGLNTNTGALVYTPNTNYNGTDTIRFIVSDGSLLATGIVAITVTPINDGPVANNQSVITPEDVSTNIVLSGTDLDGDALSFAILSGPTNGVVIGFNTNSGALIYTPNTNFNGVDTIVFTVTDGSLLATGIVSITVTPVNDGPIANNQSVITPEDVSTNIVLSGTDIDGGTLSFSILSGPTNGAVSGLNTNTGALVYTPNTNFNGGDTIVFTVTDGSLSATGIVNITVAPVNDAPLANPDNYSLLKNTVLIVPVSGVLTNDTDVENSSLTASLVGDVAHGTLNLLVDGSFTYTPSNNYVGPDSFTYRASDGTTNSSVALVSLTIIPTNSAPIANGQSVTTPEDTATNLVLAATDGDGDTLTFSIVSGPTNGILSGFNATNGTVTYVPNTNFNGSDSFTFQVNDGSTNSGIAMVSIVVTPVNDGPIANNQSVTTPEDTSTNLVLSGSDVESVVTFAILSGPTNGVISGLNTNTGALIYTPNTNFNGVDTIVFTVTDGSLFATGIVSITVTPVNDGPIANNQSVTTPEDTATNIVLTGSDVESVVTFAILSNSTNGVISGFNTNTGALLYTPNTNFNGVDTIRFTVSDGSLLATGVVSITVTPINDGPVANNQSVITPEDTSTNIVLSGTDLDGGALSFAILSGPTNGMISASDTNTGAITYVPNTNFNGVDTIQFIVSDGSLFATGIVSITVTPFNDGPIANNQSVTTPEDTATNIVLTGSDVESVVTFSILSNPTNGVISGFNTNTGALLYTPNTNFNGLDTIRFTVSDGSLLATGIVSITVTPVNDGPVANNQSVITPEDTSTNIVLSGTDIDGGTLSFAILNGPTNGVLSGLNTNTGALVYTPNTNYNGTDMIRFTVSDGSLLATGAVSIVVTPVNDGPLANNQSVTTPEDVSTNIVLSGTDIDGGALSFAILNGPTNGVLSGLNTNTGALVYTPNTNYNGADAIRFTVSDGSLFATGTVSITVTPFNDGPIANNQSVTTPEDTATNLVLMGSDTESAVTFAIYGDPTNGVISGLNTNTGVLLYTPFTNFNGTDTFTFLVSDGSLLATGIVSITVTPVNDGPAANNQSVTMPEDTSTNIVLSGTDIDGGALSFAILNGPTNGVLSGLNTNTGALVYTPNTNYNGADAIRFTVSDGSLFATGIVSVTVTPVNDGPVANNQSVVTPEDVSTNIVLSGTDIDGGALSFAILTGPTNGVLSGLNTNTGALVYIPNTNYNGTDTIRFTVSDGSLLATGAVSIVVTPVNDGPVANPDSYSLLKNTTLTVPVIGVLTNDTDAEGSSLTALLVSDVSHGTLNLLANGSFTYTPSNNYVGLDSFTYQANDGTTNSSPALVSLTILATNSAPVANNQSVTTPEDTATNLVLTASDVDGDALTFAIVNAPTNGTISGFNTNSGALTYTPNTNYNGADTLTFQVNDGTTNSGMATVNITVTPVNDAPIANGQSVSTPQGTPRGITLTGTDLEGSPLTFVIVTSPANGALSSFNTNTGTLTYTPNTNFTGIDSFTFRVNDGTTNSALATVTIDVTPLADVAVLKTGPATVSLGSNLTFTITVTNLGPSAASNVVVYDQLPAGYIFVSAVPSPASVSNGLISWSAINLASGGTTNFSLTVTSASAGIFTNIAFSTANTGDPNTNNNNGTSLGARVNTVVTAGPEIQFGIRAGTNVFNPQTGLFEQQVTVTNIGSGTVAAVRLFVDGLRTNVFLHNASGTTNGRPYVQYNAALNPGQTVVFRLEFYVPDRRPFTNSLEAVAILPATTGTNAATGVLVDRAFIDSRIPDETRYVIEFSSIPGRVYTVIYSDDQMATWQTATPSVTAGSNRTQWYDDGPPKTVSKPASVQSRFYRVILAPANP